MPFFLTTYVTIYGGMTAYALHRLFRGFGGPVKYWLPFWGLAAAMVFLPIVLHNVGGALPRGMVRAATFLAWIWLALIFWFDGWMLVTDVWNFGVATVARVAADAARAHVPLRTAVTGGLAILPLLCLWGFVEAGAVRLRTVRIPWPGAGAVPLRLVQITDLHVGRTSRAAVLRRVVALVREANPDVLVSTGDVVDSGDACVDDGMRLLAGITAPRGKFAILGNHEAYAGVARSTQLLELAGFTVLRGRTVQVGDRLRIAGVDDPGRGVTQGRTPAEADILPAERSADSFTVLLKHRPVVSDAALTRCDLQLSGHTHGGQIFPFGLIVGALYPQVHSCLTELPSGLRVYLSCGTGTWGMPLRVLSPPEVTLFLIGDGAGAAGGVPKSN